MSMGFNIEGIRRESNEVRNARERRQSQPSIIDLVKSTSLEALQARNREDEPRFGYDENGCPRYSASDLSQEELDACFNALM